MAKIESFGDWFERTRKEKEDKLKAGGFRYRAGGVRDVVEKNGKTFDEKTGEDITGNILGRQHKEDQWIHREKKWDIKRKIFMHKLRGHC